jgi:hypothetical protein
MIRTALLTATICILVSPALGDVGHNDSGEGQMGITSGSSASATTGVGPNGTEYTASVSMEGLSPNSTEDRIRDESISSSKVEFNGTIQAPTPCHVIDHEINETQEGYTFNIKTVKDQKENGTCTQVLKGINYNAEFEAETGHTLQIQHNGEEIETFNTVSDKGD